MAARVRNWGRWGPDDEIGTLNLIDDAARRAARGRRSSRAGPSPSGCPCRRPRGSSWASSRAGSTRPAPWSRSTTRSAPDPDWICFSEDVLTLATQCATHWDALAHGSYGGVIYNGYPASTRLGRRRRPLRHPPARRRGQPRRPARRGPRPRPRRARAGLPDHARTTSTPPATWPASSVEPGDIVLVRTGQMVHLAPGRARPGRLHLALARADHRDGRVVPRARRRRGGHRHARLRGLPEPARGRRTCPSTSCTWWRWA